MRPLVSVLVPARNEALRLAGCLTSLTRQSYSPLEIIVIDNASTDDTARVAASFADKVISETRPGIAYAKNAGIASARGEFIATTDADCTADPRWIEELVSLFDDPSVASVGGANLLPPQAGRFERCVDALLRFLSVPANSRYLQQGSAPADTIHNPGCNAMYRRAALQEVGGFDESMETVEDEELDWRLIRRGSRIRFNPRARVFHDRRSTWRGVARQIYRFGIGRGQFFRKYPRFAQLVRFLPPVITLAWIVSGLAAMAFSLLLRPFLWATLCSAVAVFCIAFVLSLRTGIRDLFRYTGLFAVVWCSWSWGILRGLWYKKRGSASGVVSAEGVTRANKSFFNDTAASYERINQRVISDSDWYFRGILDTLRKSAPSGGFLDVGCGTGAMLDWAQAYFSPAVGVDIAVNMLKPASASARVLCADAYALPFKAGTFSVASCHAALHHFFDYALVLKEISRVLVPGGILYIDHEIDSGFLRRFRPLMALYRSVWGMDKRYKAVCATADIEQFRLAEYHTLTKEGVSMEALIRELEKAGFTVQTQRRHCWGISTCTNSLFRFLRVKRFWQPVSPFCMILAKKER